MSRGGHYLAALSLAATTLALDPTSDRLFLALGLIGGSSLPDQVEFVFGFGERGERYSVFKHRGMSHVPWPWAILAALAVFHGWIPNAIAGLAIGALLHVVLDAFSPSGVPLLVPGRRRSFGYRHNAANAAFVYRTGTLDEFLLLIPIVAVAAGIVATHAPSLTALLNGLTGTVTRLIP